MAASSNRINAVQGHLAKSQKTQFKYTVDGCVLTEQQRQEYEDNGFIVIKGLVSEEKIDRWTKRFIDLCEQPSLRPISMTVMRDVALVKQGVSLNSQDVITKIQDFQDDEVLFEYCTDPEILKYVESFCGPKIVASHTMVINKPTDPGQGTSRHPLHQDLLYFPFRPAERICASWTAMEKVTRANGCLIAVPGSHKTELLEHGYPDWEGGVNAAYVGIMGVTPDIKYVHVEMEKGDTIFFHPLLWHGSGRNKTPKFRKAISCHFGGECRFIDVKGTLQHELEDEIKELAKIKFRRMGMGEDKITDDMVADIKMADIWELKSRPVRGDHGYLPILEDEDDGN